VGCDPKDRLLNELDPTARGREGGGRDELPKASTLALPTLLLERCLATVRLTVGDAGDCNTGGERGASGSVKSEGGSKVSCGSLIGGSDEG
jgi:hypothetical protein